MFDIETKYGKIHFSHNILNRIVVNAVEGCAGKAVLQNYRGRLNATNLEVIKGEDERDYSLKVYIVIRFGASIKAVTGEIIDRIYENTELILGQKPQKITVTVTGVLSKNIAKRHIEVCR